MIWALLEITLPLCLTFLLGLIAGWLLWRWRRRQITSTEWTALQQRESADQTAFFSLRKEHDSMQKERDEFAKKVQTLQTTVGKHIEELTANKKNTQQLKAQLEANSQSVAATQNSSNEQSSAITDLQAKLAKATTEITDLTAKADESATQAKQSDTANDELQLQIATLTADNRKLESTQPGMNDQANSDQAATVSDLQSQLTQAQSETSDLASKNEELQIKLQQSASTANERDTALDKIKQLEERLENSDQGNSEQENNELANAKAELAALDQKFKNFQASVVANRQKTDEEKQSLNAKTAQLQQELAIEKQRATAVPGESPNLNALQAQLDAKQRQANDNATELNQVKAHNNNLQNLLDEAKVTIAQANTVQPNPAMTTEQHSHSAQINQLEKIIAESKRQVSQLDAQNAKLTQELKVAVDTAHTPTGVANDNTLRAMQQTLAATQTQLNQEKSRNTQLESNHAIHNNPASAKVTPINAGQMKKLKSELAAKEEHIKELEQKLKGKASKTKSGKNKTDKNKTNASKKKTTWQKGTTKLGTPGCDHKDDLTKITGIGPKIEKVLNRLGIKSWEQLAALKVADIKTVDNALKDFSGRITRDEWVPQAKAIMRNDHQQLNGKASTAKKPVKQKTAKPKKPKTAVQKASKTKFGTPGALHRDDLKVINGIGPVIEKSLNKFGIKSWEQLAKLSAKDVKTIDEALDFPGRIGRELWVSQAKDLLKRYPDQKTRPTRRTVLNKVASR